MCVAGRKGSGTLRSRVGPSENSVSPDDRLYRPFVGGGLRQGVDGGLDRSPGSDRIDKPPCVNFLPGGVVPFTHLPSIFDFDTVPLQSFQVQEGDGEEGGGWEPLSFWGFDIFILRLSKEGKDLSCLQGPSRGGCVWSGRDEGWSVLRGRGTGSDRVSV